MKNLYAYLSETEKEYPYRIRSVADISVGDFDIIKKLLGRYELLEITDPKVTVLQSNPIDFPAYMMVGVTIIDFKTAIPVSCYYVQEEIRKALSINSSEIIVRGINDPYEIQEYLQCEETFEDSLDKPLLSTDVKYDEYNYDVDDGKQFYGDDYNKSLLNYIASAEKEKSNGIYELQPENQKNGIFDWLNKPSEGAKYNDGYDCVKPVSKNDVKSDIKPPANVSAYGNFDSNLRKNEFKRKLKGV